VVQGGAGCPRVALAEVESLDDLRFGILLLNWAVKRCPKPNVERAKSTQENSRENGERGIGDGGKMWAVHLNLSFISYYIIGRVTSLIEFLCFWPRQKSCKFSLLSVLFLFFSYRSFFLFSNPF